MSDRYAAVDVGTNSVRLLVADVTGAGLEPLDRRMHITRLGAGVNAHGRLAPDAIERTLRVLAQYRRALDSHGSPPVRAAATSAARDAANRDELFGPAGKLGFELELLSGEEEAALSFRGATAGLSGVHVPAPYLVVDIGGGSTEFVVGEDEPDSSISVAMGCVRTTEQYLASDPPAPEELSVAISAVRDELADVARALPAAQDARTLIGLAGTVTTVAAVEMGLARYDRDAIHHFRLTHAAAEDVFRTLSTEPAEQRRQNPGLEPGRADVIVGGNVILVAIMRFFGFDELLVSESDILDGLVLSQVDGRG